MAAHLLEKVNFSIDRPFGIKLDEYFSKGYELVTGKSIDSFVFQEGVTPLSTQYEVAMWTITYFTVIFGGRQIMKYQDAFKLKPFFILHNFLLTVVSGALLALFIENLVPILARHGLLYAICDNGAWTQRLELLYYLNYLVKFWELADTVFLVLKKKPLGKTCEMKFVPHVRARFAPSEESKKDNACVCVCVTFQKDVFSGKGQRY
jgi:hypothetical protein